MVAVPMLADQRDMAARVVDAGAGLSLDKRRLRAAELRGAILDVARDPRFRASFPPLQAAIAKAGGVARAADLIEAALAPGRPSH
jgi:UDP:flavonoid glycosyltransferase YjiC (YdhE family)